MSSLLINVTGLVLGMRLVSDQMSDSNTLFLEIKGSSKKSRLELVEDTPKSFLNSIFDMSDIESAITKKLFFKLSYISKNIIRNKYKLAHLPTYILRLERQH